jgi:uncharacterized protein DUF4349
MTRRLANMWLMMAIGATALAFSACSKQPDLEGDGDDTRFFSALRTTVGQGGVAQQDQAATPARMAVTHGFTLRLPSSEIEAAQRRHLDACARLGCLVINTRISRPDSSHVTANSSVRINPAGLAEFFETLASPPATVVSHSQSAEDKTIPLLDVEKRLEVKAALRDRLTAMLKESSAKTAADLLAIEKELTQVQGDIEAAIAQRDYLRTLTDAVRVDISYQGTVALTAGVDLFPIRQATTAIGQTVIWSVAALITFLAAALPWIPLVALLVWGARRAFRRRKFPAA